MVVVVAVVVVAAVVVAVAVVVVLVQNFTYISDFVTKGHKEQGTKGSGRTSGPAD